MRKLKVVLAALTPQGIEASMPVVTAGLAAATLAPLAGGCGGPASDGAGNAAASAVADTPPTLYPAHGVQMLATGRKVPPGGYQPRAESCSNAGFATQPVPASDEHLIATSRWRMWRDREHFAYRMETWHALPREGASTPEELCTFKLALTGIHGYVDAQRSIVVDLETGERTDSEGNPDIVLAAGDASTGSSLHADPAPETVAGQPC